MKLYIAFWVLFCLIAIAILYKDRKQLYPEWREYWRFLCVPWKLAIFVPAFLFVTFAGRFTDDETWDLVTGSVMSILTFLTAPWVLGVFYQVIKGKKPPRYIIVATALCLFSCSWFYDGYLYWRDGHYTSRWQGNLILSPIVYFAAAQLWNLEAWNERFVRPGFIRSDWPKPPLDKRFGPILLASIPFILIATGMLVAFVNWHF
jgi:hypothetical protein